MSDQNEAKIRNLEQKIEQIREQSWYKNERTVEQISELKTKVYQLEQKVNLLVQQHESSNRKTD